MNDKCENALLSPALLSPANHDPGTHNVALSTVVIPSRIVRPRCNSEPRLSTSSVMTTSYCLDEQKALKNKLKAAERTHSIMSEKTGGGTRITMQAGMYEAIKAGVTRYYLKSFPMAQHTSKFDQNGSTVQDTYKI